METIEKVIQSEIKKDESNDIPSLIMTEKVIDKSRRVCPLSEQIIKMLVTQLGAELSNHNMYKTFANYDWVFWYLGYNDAEFEYPTIDATNVNIKDRLEPFKIVVDREIETTMRINAIVDQAISEKDWATVQWFMSEDTKTGSLVKEQVEEESISRTILDLASEEASWLRKQNAILDFYKNK